VRLPDALHSRINTDGERHPWENALALLTLGFGVAALAALVMTWYDVAAWVALAGALIAAYDEYIAKTQPERWIILTGFGLCVAALALAMANGAIF
jgi:hypothetical protein